MIKRHQEFLKGLLTEDQKILFSNYIANNPTRTEDLDQTALEALENAINNTGFSFHKFVKETNKWHRYLQNELFRLAIEIIKNAASDDYQYDDRNAPAHKSAKKIIEHQYYL